MNKLLENIRIGIQFLEEYSNDRTRITEEGNCLVIWNEDSSVIKVPKEVEKSLNKIGWGQNESGDWYHGLSN